MRSDARKADANGIVRVSMRTALKNARVAITANGDDAEERIRAAVSHMDKAAKKGVMKKGTVNRKKSRLMRLYNAQKAKVEAGA